MSSQDLRAHRCACLRGRSPDLDITLNLDTQVASQITEELAALCAGVVSLPQVSRLWPDWLRLGKTFTG
jgi:hypothetical protein